MFRPSKDSRAIMEMPPSQEERIAQLEKNQEILAHQTKRLEERLKKLERDDG